MTQTIERSAQATCTNCPYFQDFSERNGRGWCQIFDQMARHHHKRTEACEQEIETVELAQQEPVVELKPQPSQEAPQQSAPEPPQKCEVEAEFEQGFAHGQEDCSEELRPLYTEAVDDYTCGYIEGYNSFCAQQQPVVSQPAEWLVSFNCRWGWYDVWVNRKWVGRSTTHQGAESMATKRIVLDEQIRRQNSLVMESYSG